MTNTAFVFRLQNRKEYSRKRKNNIATIFPTSSNIGCVLANLCGMKKKRATKRNKPPWKTDSKPTLSFNHSLGHCLSSHITDSKHTTHNTHKQSPFRTNISAKRWTGFLGDRHDSHSPHSPTSQITGGTRGIECIRRIDNTRRRLSLSHLIPQPGPPTSTTYTPLHTQHVTDCYCW